MECKANRYCALTIWVSSLITYLFSFQQHGLGCAFHGSMSIRVHLRLPCSLWLSSLTCRYTLLVGSVQPVNRQSEPPAWTICQLEYSDLYRAFNTDNCVKGRPKIVEVLVRLNRIDFNIARTLRVATIACSFSPSWTNFFQMCHRAYFGRRQRRALDWTFVAYLVPSCKVVAGSASQIWCGAQSYDLRCTRKKRSRE
jgi:hypothetical protein